jgi:hypothetical protein
VQKGEEELKSLAKELVAKDGEKLGSGCIVCHRFS